MTKESKCECAHPDSSDTIQCYLDRPRATQGEARQLHPYCTCSCHKKTLREIVGSLETSTTVNVINREGSCGFVVTFSEKGYGFGELTFILDKRTGEFRGDTEATDPDHVGQILMRLVGSIVQTPKPEEPEGFNDRTRR